MSSQVKHLLIIPHIKVHNANALSSPFTIGFPAMTAWLGATHALQRHLNDLDIPVQFIATGVVSHHMDLQTHKGNNDFVHSIIGTGNPLDKTGSRSAFIEEARCHLEVSLVIEYKNITLENRDQFIESIPHLLAAKMKLAGGDIIDFKTPYFIHCKKGDDVSLNQLKRALMPGYALIERRELMIDAMQQGVDALDALIDYLAIHNSCTVDDNEKVTWKTQRKQFNDKPTGWIVPIATGFHAISELGQAKNQRDEHTPHRFAESVVTLGEFKMPHKFNAVDDMLWHYHVDDDLYLCQQHALSTHTQQPDTTILSAESVADEF